MGVCDDREDINSISLTGKSLLFVCVASLSESPLLLNHGREGGGQGCTQSNFNRLMNEQAENSKETRPRIGQLTAMGRSEDTANNNNPKEEGAGHNTT